MNVSFSRPSAYLSDPRPTECEQARLRRQLHDAVSVNIAGSCLKPSRSLVAVIREWTGHALADLLDEASVEFCGDA